MPIITLAQVRSSGATTAAVALARSWPRPVVVIEADLAGGDLAARYGVATSPGLVDLAATPRSRPAELRSVAQNLGGVDVVAAPIAPETTRAALEALGPASAWVEAVGDGADVLVDCGRLSLPPAPVLPLVEEATVAVFLCRPTAPSVVSLRQRVASLPESVRQRSVVVVVGDRPYPADEVAATVGLPLGGVLADDPVAAAALGAAEPVRMARSALLRSATVVAEALVARCAQPTDCPSVSAEADRGRWSAVIPRARLSFSQNGTR
jgi:hypothetical protein